MGLFKLLLSLAKKVHIEYNFWLATDCHVLPHWFHLKRQLAGNKARTAGQLYAIWPIFSIWPARPAAIFRSILCHQFRGNYALCGSVDHIICGKWRSNILGCVKTVCSTQVSSLQKILLRMFWVTMGVILKTGAILWLWRQMRNSTQPDNTFSKDSSPVAMDILICQ